MTKPEKKRLDVLWQQKVTGGQCTYPDCHKEGSEGHHVMKRRYLNTRWLIENGRGLCREHHQWADTHPQAYEDLIVSEIGEIEYGRLRDEAFMVVRQDYNELRERLSSP